MPFVVFIMILIIVNKIYVKNYKMIRNFLYKLSNKEQGKEFKRYIDEIYSPSIVSYLYNQQIEVEKDLVSDILNLYARKIIYIKQEDNGRYSINLSEENNNFYKSVILENDRYIIDTIVLKKTDFKYEQWQEKIKKVYREQIMKTEKNEKQRKFEEYTEKNQYFLFLGVPLISFIIASIIAKNISVGLVIGGLLALIIIIISEWINGSLKRDENRDMHLTKNAKEELKKWIGFKRFIEKYTLLEEKEFEQIILYERYIPYAMVLDINDKYKETMVQILNKKEINLILEDIKKYKKINNVFVEYFNS